MSELRSEFSWLPWRPVQFLFFLLLRVGAMVVTMFPPRASEKLGRVVGTLGRWIDRKHRKWAAGNLERAGMTDDVPRMIRRVYDHLGRVVVEVLTLSRLIRLGGASRFVDFEGSEILKRELARGRGVIAVTGHFGNWELAGLALTAAGYPFHSLARPIANPHFQRFVNDLRRSTGQEIILTRQPLKAMVEVLKRNEVLAILADQDAREGGEIVEFLGRPASTTKSPALLSLKYEVPIIPFNICRKGSRHHIVFTEPLFPEDYRDRGDAVHELTQDFTARLEEFVRARPDQWLWLHPRWRSCDHGKVRLPARKLNEVPV